MTSPQIMLVEDEKIVANDIEMILKDLGYAVPVVAGTGEEAVAKAAATNLDLILMDIKLGGKMDGVEAALRMRERFKIPVVYLTAHADEATLERAKKTEPFGYLIKPFEEKELYSAIEIALYRHKVEQVLEASWRSFRDLIDKSIDGMVVLDRDEKVIYFMNASAEALFGCKTEELIGVPFAFPVVPGEVREVEILRKNGEKGIAQLRIVEVQWEGENAYLAMFRDVTESKILEKAFRQAQKMEAVGRLAGGLAHDFNNVLTVISGNCEVLMSDPAVCERPELKEIKEASGRAANLTHQLLAFSRQQIISPKITNLNDLVSNLEKMLRRLIGEDITLSVILEPHLGSVNADPGQIEQVLVNLAVNARDAMPGGGVLTIRTANVTLDQQYTETHPGAKAGEYVMIAVRDIGCGMNEEVKEHLFEPFFTTKGLGKGTGLGLATSYGIVKQNNGYISVDSKLGSGTIFKVLLPRCGTPTPPAQKTPAKKEIPTGAETIFLVEDEQAVRDIAGIILRRQGYKVLESADGLRALERAEKNPQEKIHLLVTDVVMPHMSGKEVAERLKKIHPAMKILYISGHTEDTVILEEVRSGAAFLQKPFSHAELAIKVREVLDKP